MASDNFNRAPANPLDGSWATSSAWNALQLVSNAVQIVTASSDSAMVSTASTATDSQVTLTVTNASTTIAGPAIHMSTSAGDGYALLYNAGFWHVYVLPSFSDIGSWFASPSLATVVQRPFAAPAFFGPVIKRFYGDTSLRNLQTGTLAPPFVAPRLLPVHFAPQRRPIRILDQQDNYLPLRTTVVLRPFAQLEWPGPAEYRLHFEAAPEILLAPFFRGSGPVELPTDMQELAHKLTAVDTTFTLDFISRLDAGETISSVTTAISVFSGTDANPSGLKASAPSISRTRVRQLTTGGNPGVLYALTASARTSTGRTLTMLGIFAVLDPDEVPT